MRLPTLMRDRAPGTEVIRAALRQIALTLLVAAPLAAGEAAPIHVDEPLDGATLTGGSTAVIRWSGSIEECDVEEWEAFLSVDGGRYYSDRITPHLDLSIREFRWNVPNVASRDVRILLRFGNEKDEHAVAVPLSLKIEPVTRWQVGAERVSEAGESARPGDPGVTRWA